MQVYNATLNKLDIKETKRYAGLAKSDFADSEIEKACREVQVLAKPRGIWEVYDYNSCLGEILASPTTYIKGSKIKNYLIQANKLIFLAVNIGKEVENMVTNYFKNGQYSYSLILDAAATTAVEKTADEIEKAICQEFQGKGYQLLKRFSPGYGDWDIKFQPAMLNLTNATKIDMSLTESYMLVPRKSITAVIGLVPNQLTVNITNNNCDNCNKVNCLARKEPNL